MEFITQAEPLLKTFWYLALPVSLIFIIQTIMAFAGLADVDFDHDTGDHGSYFTIRNLINFLLGFSWGGIALYSTIKNSTLLIISAFMVGLTFLVLFFYIMKQFLKLEEDNTFALEQTVGKEAEVYLTIPAACLGKGKVMVSVKGTTYELEAMTDGPTLVTGSKVKVKSVLDEATLLVNNL